MIKEIIVVEGRDDVTAVKKACNCEIIITGGIHFQKNLFKKLAKAQKEKGIIILTDPDYTGEKIRRIINKKIKGAKNAYIEKDKSLKNGDIGVENAKPEDILNALKNAKVRFENISKEFNFQDMIDYGLTGENSKELREKIGNKFSIGYCNSKQFLIRLNKYNISREKLEEALKRING